ncbi:MAG: metal ABC transporter permease [Hyphomicrobiaceae bacterium]|nr:metal ABC transporter permease [Hyphomicrobiaceae bacterium]
MIGALGSALMFQAGYNAAIAALGSALFGAAAGAVGTFLFLRKRSLVSDALAHATLPGIALAFLVMAFLGGSGRWLPGLLAGAALAAITGLFAVSWLTHHTRLSEDAAIGAVLSAFFGLGVVVLSLIQTLSVGEPAGLDGFLLGSTAGMVRSDVVTIAAGAVVSLIVLFLARRPLALIAFDAGYGEARGYRVRGYDILLMGLVTAITVTGLKIVGLVLVVALLIIPPAMARFWTDRLGVMLAVSAAGGALSGYGGAAFSAAAPDLPTGPVIVLLAFVLFFVSMLAAPRRGILARALKARRFELAVHRRQGLLALSHDEPIYDRLTLKVLRRAGFVRGDGVVTAEGLVAAQAARDDEIRRITGERLFPQAASGSVLDPLDVRYTPDEIAAIERAVSERTLGQPEGAA